MSKKRQTKNKRSNAQHRQNKKEVVLASSKSKLNPMVLALAIGIIVGAIGIGFYIADQSRPSDSPSASTEVPNPSTGAVTTTEVSYPLDLFADGQAKHFEYAANGMTIRYFILKSADGIVRAAFDACDVCWRSGKGYFQDGDDMVCRNCGRRFASVLVNEVQGGCNPAPLQRVVKGDQLVIQVNDILQGQRYFNL